MSWSEPQILYTRADHFALCVLRTLQLEFKYLSHLTGDIKYADAVENVMDVIRDQSKMDGLVPIMLSTETGQFVSSDIRLGSRGDSYYEYLLKQYLQTNRTEEVYREMYDEAMHGVRKHLIRQGVKQGLIYTSELLPRRQAATGQT